MKKFEAVENGTIRISNLMFGLIQWFHNRGHYRTCSIEEGLMLDQRVLGPAYARGLLDQDGKVWYLTEVGVAFYEQFMHRDAWKDTPSRQYSHWIKVARSRHRFDVIKGGRKHTYRRAANG